MIARLAGTLIERGPGVVVLDVHGVGYEVHVSAMTMALMPEAGAPVTLRVFTQAAENKLALYGFATAEERALFDRLITVKNVGPTTAVEILSGGPGPIELARLIAARDAAALTKIRGVGKKRADLLVVELAEHCEVLLLSWGASGGPVTTLAATSARARSVRAPILEDVASALVNMGWRQVEADKAVSKLEVPASATVETLLVSAIKQMPRV